MTAATANRSLAGDGVGYTRSTALISALVQVAAGEHIYAGTIVGSKTASTSATPTLYSFVNDGTQYIRGVALEEVDASGDDPLGAARRCNIAAQVAELVDANAGGGTALANIDRLTVVYAVDDQTVSKTPSEGQICGVFLGLDRLTSRPLVLVDPFLAEVILFAKQAAFTQTYATADRTIAAPTAAAIGATLTDNSGFTGTHDDTLAASATPATLTDNSTFEPTHDDTLAANAAPVTLTDNSGFTGTHDDTLAASATPAALLVGTLGGAADGSMETVGDTSTGDRSTQIMNNFQELFVKFGELRTQVDTIAQNLSDVTAKVIELVTSHGVSAQNVSDVAAKVVELRTQADTVAQNVSDVAAKAIELVTQGNANVVDGTDTKQGLNAVIDTLQAIGAAG